MDRSLKWRTVSLLLGVLLCAGLLAPTWPGSDALPSWFPFKKKISLGLDLQGGMHIVYTIALDRAVDDKASEIKNDLEARFTEDKIDAKVKTPTSQTGAVTIVLADDKKKAEIESRVHSDFGDTIQERDCAPTDGPNAICFRVSTSYADGIKKAALTNAVSTIRDRINEKGVSEPSVVEKGDDIIVELPGDPEDPVMLDTLDIIKRTSKLEFKVVDDSTECVQQLDQADRAGQPPDQMQKARQVVMDTRPNCYMARVFQHVGSGEAGVATEPKAAAAQIRADIGQWSSEETGVHHTEHTLRAYDRDDEACLAKATDKNTARCRVTGMQVLQKYMKELAASDPKFVVPDDHEIGYEPQDPDPTAKDQRRMWRTYYLEHAVRLTGSAISNAAAGNDPNTGAPIVLLDFNRYGSRVFGDLTTQIVGKRLAAVLDGKVRSAPTITVPIRTGRAMITIGTGGSIERREHERDDLVGVLKTGSLPAPLEEQSHSKVGATLGRDAIDKTKVSFIIGIILVILIMVGIYRWSGWIAVFSVMFHIVMTLAVMAAFGATLTLPGVAAIVLSIGMEVDGNILIYERIRDELLLGKSVRGAVDLGFSRAFSAILDGQLTTAAAGWVLLQYGSGPIKGFAVMLLVGVFTTLSTNIWVTRIFFDWYIARKKGQLATISI
jgi:preprotein translocase subunit SecD